MQVIQGTVWKFGDNINTDNLSPAPYMFSIQEIAAHCLEAVRPEFCKEVRPGDMMLAGDNFGTGSSRETAAAALKHLGVALIIAKSFARIFFRNAVDIGLPVLICSELYSETDDKDVLSVELDTGIVINKSKTRTFHSKPIPGIMGDILQAGGLVFYALGQNWNASQMKSGG